MLIANWTDSSHAICSLFGMIIPYSKWKYFLQRSKCSICIFLPGLLLLLTIKHMNRTLWYFWSFKGLVPSWLRTDVKSFLKSFDLNQPWFNKSSEFSIMLFTNHHSKVFHALRIQFKINPIYTEHFTIYSYRRGNFEANRNFSR